MNDEIVENEGNHATLSDPYQQLNDFKICCLVLVSVLVFLCYINVNDWMSDPSEHGNLVQASVILSILLCCLIKHLFAKYKLW